ncbi:MAG: PsbP-related protein, partial [Chloroflexota bacterium]
MLTIVHPKYTIRTLVTVLCLLMLGISISIAQEDTDTTTYEDKENGITFEYPATWTDTNEYDDDMSASVDITMPDQSAGVTVIVIDSGEGQTILDEINENITVEDDTDTANYAGVTFT